MDRSTIDKIGIVVGIIALVVPMRWWLRSVLTFIGTAFFGDLILRLPWIRKLPEAEPLKIYFTLCFFYIVLLLSWDPIRQEYFKEQERYVLQKQMSELKREEQAEPKKATEEKLPQETKRSLQTPALKAPKLETKSEIEAKSPKPDDKQQEQSKAQEQTRDKTKKSEPVEKPKQEVPRREEKAVESKPEPVKTLPDIAVRLISKKDLTVALVMCHRQASW